MVGVAILVEPQDVAVGPGIGAVERDTDRHVAEQRDAALVRIVPQREPLPEEQVLDDLERADAVRLLALHLCQRFRVATHVGGLPLGPGTLAVLALEHPEKRIVVQPVAVVALQEAVEIRKDFEADGLFEAIGREEQQARLDRDQRAVVDIALGQGSEFPDLILAEQPQVDQIADIDEHLVARERRQRLVGRIAVSRWP